MEDINKPQACEMGCGRLPGSCAALAYPFVSMQESAANAYEQTAALENGTLFPGLNLPFHKAMKGKLPNASRPLTELMALDFAIHELVLYLDTHKNDKEALSMLNDYQALAKEGREKYEKRYGPLCVSAIGKNSFDWSNNPWPWDVEGSDG